MRLKYVCINQVPTPPHPHTSLSFPRTILRMVCKVTVTGTVQEWTWVTRGRCCWRWHLRPSGSDWATVGWNTVTSPCN